MERKKVCCEILVRSRGLEPPRLAALAPQASASASSATTASCAEEIIINDRKLRCRAAGKPGGVSNSRDQTNQNLAGRCQVRLRGDEQIYEHREAPKAPVLGPPICSVRCTARE